MKEDQLWWIWSNEHTAWWAPARQGYVTDKDDAGLYSTEEAMQIVHDATKYQDYDEIPNEAMVPYEN